HDVTTDQGAPVFTPNVPAPGGKAGVALRFDDAPGSDGVIALHPTGVVIPTDSTTTFRIYIASKSKFMATYDYGPGEGLRFLDGGGLQNSQNGSLPGSWEFNKWYTVGLHVDSNTNVSIYFKQGADAQLTAADLIEGPFGGPGLFGPFNRTDFFNY